MFFKKKQLSQIDDEQIALVENAQQRIRQKKRLYNHFVFWVFSSIILWFVNVVVGVREDILILDYPWFVSIIVVWSLLLLFHTFQVFITKRFMGKEWEKEQLKRLTALQQVKIEKIKRALDKEAQLIADSQFQNEQIQPKQCITIIAAAATNNALGKDNNLIWHLSNDLKRFKRLTKGHHVIMGRKTFESMPKALPSRVNVVITRQKGYQPEGAVIVHSLDEALEIAKDDEQPFIIGGGEIYTQALNIAHRIELTRVHADFEADTFFPSIDESVWKETFKEDHFKDASHDYDFTFIQYEKNN